LLGVCIAAPFESAAASSTRYTPQEEYLAKQAIGNFGCKVNSLIVTTDNPGELDSVTPDAIRAAFTNVATLEWTHIAQMSFSSFDGRNSEKVLGTPGGDMGEFILALHAYSKVSAATLSVDDITALFEKYLKKTTRAKFSYETDEKSYMRLAVATGCRNLHISELGGMKRKKEAVLALISRPEHIGDPFIRFLATNTTDLDLNPDYIQGALVAYHTVLWTTPSKLAEKLCYLELKGPHKQAALVNIKTPAFCVDQGLAPMVSPLLACPAPVFIYHPDAVRLLRRELATIFTHGTQVDPRDVLETHNSLAENNLEKFMVSFAANVPTYTVEFFNSSPLLSSDVSAVEE